MKDTAAKKPAMAKRAPRVCSPLWAKKPNSAKLCENRAKITPTGKHTVQPITINLFVGREPGGGVRVKRGEARHFVLQGPTALLLP